MFVTGQRVVCVNDEFPVLAYVVYKALPKKDSVYTVRDVGMGKGDIKDDNTPEIGITLKEIVNPPDPSCQNPIEPMFHIDRFRPLEELSTEDGLSVEEEREDLTPVFLGTE